MCTKPTVPESAEGGDGAHPLLEGIPDGTYSLELVAVDPGVIKAIQRVVVTTTVTVTGGRIEGAMPDPYQLLGLQEAMSPEVIAEMTGGHDRLLRLALGHTGQLP